MKPHEKIIEARRLLQEAHQELAKFLGTERSRRRGEALRQSHVISNMMATSQMYYSQAGQDRVIDGLLGQKRDGVFVDVGGYDGVTGSNTLFFEAFRNWTGVIVEPSPKQIKQAENIRTNPCVMAAVAGKSGKSDFMEVTSGYTQMSGFLDSYDKELLERVRAHEKHEEVVHKLSKKTLQSILNKHKLKKIDLISLDVEGGEMDILNNFPFKKYDIEVWSIENNAQSSDLPELMRSKGYDLVEFAGVDDIYRKKQS